MLEERFKQVLLVDGAQITKNRHSGNMEYMWHYFALHESEVHNNVHSSQKRHKRSFYKEITKDGCYSCRSYPTYFKETFNHSCLRLYSTTEEVQLSTVCYKTTCKVYIAQHNRVVFMHYS